jgi:FkbM family methyltransferase
MDTIEIKNYNNEVSGFFHLHENDYISYELKNGKIWEPYLHRIFEKYINKDSVVLEAGCHIGTHSVKLSMLSKKLICFEPLKQSNILLKENLEKNKCDNTIVYDQALSDEKTTSYFGWVSFNNLGGAGLIDNPMGIPNGGNVSEESKYPIETITIDSLNLEELNFIKLDVEGYESKVINGGINTIGKFRPTITLESWANHSGLIDVNHTKEMFKNLLDLNYSVQHIGGADWLFLPNP